MTNTKNKPAGKSQGKPTAKAAPVAGKNGKPVAAPAAKVTPKPKAAPSKKADDKSTKKSKWWILLLLLLLIGVIIIFAVVNKGGKKAEVPAFEPTEVAAPAEPVVAEPEPEPEEEITGVAEAKIRGLEFAFKNKAGNIVTNYGEALNAAKSQYIATRATLNCTKKGTFKVQCKLYCDGALARGYKNKEDYTYTSEIKVTELGLQTIELGSWGDSIPGTWPAGPYTFEVWSEGKLLISDSFQIN